MMDETRTRFLTAIAKQLPAGRVIEVHLFPAIRQGGVESGVAVVALERETFPSLEVTSVDLPTQEAVAAEAALLQESGASDSSAPSRYTVFSARYRHTLKGLDRGKWEVSVTEEADAPLITVDAVVRGVQRRSGEADDTIRLSGEEFRAAVPMIQPLPS